MICVETPRKTIEGELEALRQKVNEGLPAKVDAFYMAAIQALYWINEGLTRPSETKVEELF